MPMGTFFGQSWVRGERSRRRTRAAMRRRGVGLEILEARRLLCGSPSPLPGIGSQARNVVIQTYETLVGESPSLAQQNRLLRIEAGAGQNALVPAIVATPAIYNRTANGDANGYVTLAAATLDPGAGPGVTINAVRSDDPDEIAAAATFFADQVTAPWNGLVLSSHRADPEGTR